ncbi:MAG: glycosyltransferase family 4 protein [Methanomicrobiales archaeon]|nr:glycosyltransferase family 4 protein [Methanomicrobiales archaeon]
MNLCIIGDGRSIHTQRWAEYFGQNHQVHLITYDPVGRTLPGVTEHVIPSLSGNLWLSFWPRHLRIRRLIREIDPDLVHAHFITKYGFHLPDDGKRPILVTAWGDDILILPPKSRLIRHFTRKVLERVDRIHAVSEHLRQRIIADYGIPPEKIRHVPFGIDTTAFSPDHRDYTRGNPVTVFSNRGFFPVYDSTTLVDGFARAHAAEPGIRLLLKGDGPEEQMIQAHVSDLDLDGPVTLAPRTGYDRVPADLRGADLFVSTATSDGTPVSLLEAMSSALPCIATDVGGVPEWIRDGENGLLIPPRNPGALAGAILRLVRDPDLRRALGTRARETVLARGDWQVLMQGVEEEYEELAGRTR